MINNKEIIEQLAKILESANFKSSKLLSSFLKYVVEETLKGNGKNIKGYNIAIDAFKRNLDFDSQKDSIVRITAIKLRKELDAYYGFIGKSDLIRIRIPKGTYQPEFEKLNIKKPESVFPFNIRSKAYYLVGAIIILVLGLFWIASSFSTPEKLKEKPSILFFEIKSLGNDPENIICAQGITEDIVVLSSRFSELSIFGPIKNEEVIDMNNFENPDFLFELRGNLKKTDSLFILNIHLNNYKTGKVLWSKSFEKNITVENLIDIEHEVSNDIAKHISSIYGIVNKEVISNSSNINPKLISSHRSVLLFFKSSKTLSYKDFLIAKKALLQTVEEEPNYAVAHSLLGQLYLGDYLLYKGDSLESFSKAHQLIDKALKLDPNNVLVQNSKAHISYLSHELDEFRQAVDKVQSLNPTSIITGEHGLFLVNIGETKRGLDMINKAMKYAISYPGYFHFGPFMDFYRKGDFKKALLEANQVQLPKHYGDPLCRAVSLVNLNRLDEAIEAKREVLKIIPDFKFVGANMLSRTLFISTDVDAIMKDFLKIEIGETENIKKTQQLLRYPQ